MEKNEVLDILPHRYPFLFIDRIIEYQRGSSIKCIKNVTVNEPYFLGHFPGRPIMPGVLLLEAAAQAGIILYKKTFEPERFANKQFLLSSSKIKNLIPVEPGDQIEIQVSAVKILTIGGVFQFVIHTANEIAAKGEFTFAVTN